MVSVFHKRDLPDINYRNRYCFFCKGRGDNLQQADTIYNSRSHGRKILN